MFKNGDRVRAIDGMGMGLRGKTGTIIDGKKMLVKFDDWYEGHNGNGIIETDVKDFSCWFVFSDAIEYYEETPRIKIRNELLRKT